MTGLQVKAAYRRRAVELHPDRNPNSDGVQFKELKKCYDVSLHERAVQGSGNLLCFDKKQKGTISRL